MKIVFQADATREVGVGHVMRCWALAEELTRHGANITWQGAIDVPWVASALSVQGWDRAIAPRTPDDQALAFEADAVIVDSYTLDHSFRDSVLERGTPVVAIVDDAHSIAGPASLWVNPGAPSSLHVDRPRAFLNGPDYVMIRREIRELRKFRAKALLSGVRPKGITFLLGGTDFANVAPLIDSMSGLSRTSGGLFAGPGVKRKRGSEVQWISGGPELLRRASLSQLVVSTAGVSSWEMTHIGVPLALLQVADNQFGNYSWMTAMRWAMPLGRIDVNAIDAPGFRETVAGALASSEAWGEVHVTGVDGLGAARVAGEVLALLSPWKGEG